MNDIREAQNFRGITISTRSEGFELIDSAIELAHRYSVVTVQDLLELCGLPASYFDSQIGWNKDEVRSFYIRPYLEGRGCGFELMVTPPNAIAEKNDAAQTQAEPWPTSLADELENKIRELVALEQEVLRLKEQLDPQD